MMLKRMVIMLVAVALTFGAVFGFLAFKARMISQIMAAQSNPPQAVSTAVVGLAAWQPRLEAVGSARAVNGANLSSQISGIVSAIHFESGADVKQGSPLVDLIAEDDIAHLEALKATTELARLTYERDQRLVRTKAISEQTVDSDNGRSKTTRRRSPSSRLWWIINRSRRPSRAARHPPGGPGQFLAAEPRLSHCSSSTRSMSTSSCPSRRWRR